jgi:hypothetical protein
MYMKNLLDLRYHHVFERKHNSFEEILITPLEKSHTEQNMCHALALASN